MNHKQKLGYMVLGAVIMLVGLGLGAIVSPPLIAQKYNLFDEIRCSKITVADKYDKPAIVLSSDEATGNGIVLFNQAGKQAAILHASEDGNSLGIYNPAGKHAVSLGSSETGSDIALLNEEEQMAISLLVDKELGRLVAVLNEEGVEAIRLGSLNKIGSNNIALFDKAGEKAIGFDSNILGNSVKIFDKAGKVRWEAP